MSQYAMHLHKKEAQRADLKELDKVNLLRQFRKVQKLYEYFGTQFKILTDELFERGVFDCDDPRG